MTATVSAQDQIAEYIASAMPEKIMSFKFSSSVQKRIEGLVHKRKDGVITQEEVIELERYLLYDNLIGLAKVRASMKISGK